MKNKILKEEDERDTMNIHQALEFIEESPAFKKFFKKGEHTLVHLFTTVDKEQAPWQAGYYSKKNDKIVVFTAGEEVTKSPEEEAFKKEGTVPKLDVEKVKITIEKALKTAQEFKDQKKKAENVNKIIVILQTLEEKPTWNITMITQAFNMINVRVNAETGKIENTDVSSILNLGKQV